MAKQVDNKQIERVRKMTFNTIYPMYIQKVEKKGYSKKEVNEIIKWLTGYSDKELSETIEKNINIESFFMEAKMFNPRASKITGTICGYRIEEIEDEIVRKVRYLDKLIDELSKGKTLEQMIKKLDKQNKSK